MNGGDEVVRRTYRLGAEAVARVVDHPRVNARPLVERTDSAPDLDRPGNRGRSHLRALAAREMVVLPNLTCALGAAAIASSLISRRSAS